ncbi:MAG: HlyD family type I secretion periplasmic adaptor subunit, partial [Pseudomonadota bacterium]
IIAVTVAGFGSWAATAPIAGAVVATGTFVATGTNKTVQHLEGGIIEEILVSEGDEVEAGQVLVRLDLTSAQTERRRLRLQIMRLMAIHARVQAEAAFAETLRMPDELLALSKTDPDVAEMVTNQVITFEAGRRHVASEVAILEDSIAGLKARQEGTRIQRAHVQEQLGLIADELAAKQSLLDKGLTRRSEVLALRRLESNLRGEIGRLDGEYGDAVERIARVREEIGNAHNRFRKSAADNLHEASGELQDLRERMRRADLTIARKEIKAPVAGIVVRMRYHTSGGVIEAGKPVLELLPVREELLLEARVMPKDIDVVARGQTATVRLTALNQRTTPMMSGEVVYLSADALRDERTGLVDTYVARIRLNPTTEFGFAGFRPTPGMPAEVLITTTDRTFLEYLVQPVKDSMSRAFRES